MDCYTHDKRTSLADASREIWRSGVLFECVENGYLKVRPKEIAIFNPQLYRRLLADTINAVQDSRIVLFVLAFPTQQLSRIHDGDKHFGQLLKQRERYLVEYMD